MKSCVSALSTSMLVLMFAVGCRQTAAATTPTTSTAPPPATVSSGETITGDTPCPMADGSSRRVILFAKPPPRCIDITKAYSAVVETTKGTFTMALDSQLAPNNTNNFVVLARYHYFDGLPFDQNALDEYIGGGVHPPPAHGDPGYRIASELPPDKALYNVPGTVIIDTENTGADGSLFIVLLSAKGVAPRFTIVGHVTDGLTAAQAIGHGEGAPATGGVATIERITITET